MNIYNFPGLIQIEIFKQLDLFELFLLSTCSNKMKNVIKSRRSTRSEIQVDVFNFNKRLEFSVISKSQKRKFLTLACRKLTDTDGIFQVDDYIMPCVYRFPGEIQINCYDQFDPAKEILEFCSDLFHAPPTVLYNMKALSKMCLTPPGAIKMSRMEQEVNDKELLNFYRTHPNQEFSMVEKCPEIFPGCYEIKNLVVLNSGYENLENLMMNFNGENAVFETSRQITGSIILFLDFWIKTRNTRLRSVIYNQNGNQEIHMDSILRDLYFHKWNPARRGRHFPYDSIIKRYYPMTPDTFDCSHGWDIQRVADGTLATIKLTPKSFMFFVWKPEEWNNDELMSRCSDV